MWCQEANGRNYIHCDIVMRVVALDKLKMWNNNNRTIDYDEKFLRLLLLDVFGMKVLKVSSLEDLDAGKIRFARGIYIVES